MAQSENELKSLLMGVKEESEKASLKLNIKKTKIMACGSHHFMANRRGKGRRTDFLFLGSVDGDCSHEIRRQLFFGRKAMTNHFADKCSYYQGYDLSSSHVQM